MKDQLAVVWNPSSDIGSKDTAGCVLKFKERNVAKGTKQKGSLRMMQKAEAEE